MRSINISKNAAGIKIESSDEKLPALAIISNNQFKSLSKNSNRVFLRTQDYEITLNPAVDQVTVEGTVYAPGSLNAQQLFDVLDTSEVFLRPATGGDSGRLPIDARIVYVGDSITAHQMNAGQQFYFGDAFATFANIFSGHKLFQPIGGNKGVAGETSTQVLARIQAVVDLKPRLSVVLVGTNDVTQSVSESTIKDNLRLIYWILKQAGSKVVAITIPDRFSPAAALSSANETIRQNINTWIKTSAEVDVVVDSQQILTSAAMFADGLHPNTLGDSLLGKAVASAIDKLVSKAENDVNVGYHVDPRSVNNPFFNGQNADGTALNWSKQDYLGGATRVFSKEVINGKNKQLITLSGNYTGNGSGFQFKQDYNSAYIVNGDYIEGVVDLEILTPLQNVAGIAPSISIYTSGFGATLAFTEGFYPTSTDLLNLPVGRYIIKTPVRQVTGGVPAIISTALKFSFKDAASSSPVSGQVRIHRLGLRKVNHLS